MDNYFVVSLSDRWIVILVKNIDIDIRIFHVLNSSVFVPNDTANFHSDTRSRTSRKFRSISIQRRVGEEFVVENVNVIRTFETSKKECVKIGKMTVEFFCEENEAKREEKKSSTFSILTIQQLVSDDVELWTKLSIYRRPDTTEPRSWLVLVDFIS